jgi:hypothetical protein
MGKKSRSGLGMINPDHIPRAKKLFFGLKYLNSLMRIRDAQKFGAGMGKIWIWDLG